MTQRFISRFIVEIDVTFNTNEIQLPLFLLCRITNTISIFTVVYCYIKSKSMTAFVFINKYLKDFFLFDKYLGPSIMLGDFFARLSQAILKIMQ